jgi:hypothetical protein
MSELVRGVRICYGCQDLLRVSGFATGVRTCQGCQDLLRVSELVRGVRTCQNLAGPDKTFSCFILIPNLAGYRLNFPLQTED